MTPLFQAKKGHFVVDETIGLPLVISLVEKEISSPILLICSNLYKAQRLVNSISNFFNSDEVVLFPNEELIRTEMLSESKEFLAERLFALDKIITNKAKIVVTNISGLARYLPEKDLFKLNTIRLKKHDIVDISTLKTQLIKSGYTIVNKIDQSLQVAIRGDILDVYSLDSEYPLRIEFDYDEISEIRYFDIATQTSIKSVDEVNILPATDLLFNDEERANIQDELTKRMKLDKAKLSNNVYDNLLENTNNDIFSLLNYSFEPKLYKYYGTLKKTHCNLFDYCNEFVKVFVSLDSIETGYNLFIEESYAFINELVSNGKLISNVNLYYDLTSIINGVKHNNIYTSEFIENSESINIDIKSVPYFASKSADALNIISKYLNDEFKIVICLEALSDIHFIEEILTLNNIPYELSNEINLPKKSKITIALFSLYQGFCLYSKNVVVLSNKELFVEKVKATRFTNKFKEGTILKSFEDLSPGDYVVHEYQGIGQFDSLVTLEVQNKHNDYLKIIYSGGEILYVPLTQFQLVRKYMGKEGYSPRLSRLHTKDWENQKKKVKERVNELANRLMNLYIERSKIKGFAFEEDDELQKEFEDDFEFEL
ncbi:MAG: CarD family transcriptional regulator, partial [Bacilli bacterium]